MQESGSSFAKWAFIILGIFGLVYFGYPLVFGEGNGLTQQPLTLADWGTTPEAEGRAEASACELSDGRAQFSFSTQGGALTSARMVDAKYAESVDKPDTRIQLVSTSREQRMPLRTSLRASGEAAQQVDFDNLDFQLAASDASSCTFVHKTASAEITKVISLSGRPFELDVSLTVKNLASEAKRHRYAIEQTSWRSEKETAASIWDLGRRPEWMTDVVTHTTKGTTRHLVDSYEPGDFDAKNGFTGEHFLRAEGEGVWAAVSANYFANVVFHKSGPAQPAAETLVEDGSYYQVKPGTPLYGHMYRARLAYPEHELAPNESVSYESVAFVGPKEREVLAVVGGTEAKRLDALGLIDLGMFAFIGKHFVGYVGWLFGVFGSWGVAIALLTVTVKILVFPLQIPQLKSSVAMRRLKPQVDAINAKYGDDMTQKALAMQEVRELYGKEGVNQFIGCLPMLLQFPVWIALYQALGTAVEIYHAPFLLPLIPDLTTADPYHVIPIVLGASSFLQQKMMPMQGVDPAQAKMMLYLMPGMFMAMMFFLPAGLGVYMLTNTWVGIIQQALTEQWMKKKLKTPAAIEVREVKKTSETPALGKGKVRARG
jgi:YidC/Oxa1 family membrane protein insertase